MNVSILIFCYDIRLKDDTFVSERETNMAKLKLKSVLASLLAAGLLMTSVPVGAQAESTLTKTTAAQTDADSEETENNYEDGEAIILYKNNASVSNSLKSGEALNGKVEIVDTCTFDTSQSTASTKSTSSSSEGFSISLVKSDEYSTDELITYLNGISGVQYAEPNYAAKTSAVTNDPYEKYQWAIENTGQNGGTQGDDINAETLTTSSNEDEKVIAIIDTGVDYEHEDLSDIIWNNPYNSKKLRGQHGYDFVNDDDDPMDDYGHGTHCAGIMAAETNNEVGIAGTVQNNNVKIMALKCFDAEGAGYTYDAISAYNYIYTAQQLGVNVVAVNNSWNCYSTEDDELLLKVINLVGEEGALSICSAGNEGVNTEDAEASAPASFDSDYIISVAASDENDELAGFSSYGSNVDIAAPGTSILSTLSDYTFNPTLYDNKDDYCSLYYDFESGELVQTMEDGAQNGAIADEGDISYGFEQDGSGEMSVSLSDDTYFGEASEGTHSLKWTIKGAEADGIYTLYLPYTAEESSTALYDALSVKANSTAEEVGIFYMTDGPIEGGKYNIENEEWITGTYLLNDGFWFLGSNKILDSVSSEQQRAISMQIYAVSAGDYTVYIDNLGVSKSGVEEESFGKYTFMSGTSMATPYVTGAVAALANAFADETVIERKARVLGCVRKSDSLTDYVNTGGTLDLSKAETPCMTVEDMTLNDSNQIEISGYYLDGASLTVNGEAVTPIQQTDSSIIIDASSYLNKSVTIEITKDDDSVTKKMFVADGESFDQEEGIYSGYLYNTTAVSDGENIYCVDADGDVCIATLYDDADTDWFDWNDCLVEYQPEIFGGTYATAINYTITVDTDIICSNKKLYTVLTLDLGYVEESIIASFDQENGWQKYADIPQEFSDLSGVTIAAYNGQIYLAGGIDDETGELSTAVMSYDESTESWNNQAQLPEARCFSKAMQTGDKLIITLGANGKDTDVKNLIYNGSQWTVSQAEIGTVANADSYEYYVDGSYEQFPVLSAQTGIVKDGIIYTDMQVDGLGDTFTYSLNDDKFESTGYCLGKSSLSGDALVATTVKDKLYVIYGDNYVYESDEEDYLSSDDEDDYWITWSISGEWDDETATLSVCSMPIESGFICVTDESGDDAYVDGAGYYLPGDTISLVPKIYDEGEVKTFTVDGENIKADSTGAYSYQALADGSFYSMKTAATAEIYVSEITLDKKNVKLAPSESYELYATVYPDYATNQKIKWSTSDSSVATVNSKGVVTAAANAKKGSTAVIRATAKDTGKVYAKCTVKIKKLSKNSKVTVGDITYKVTKLGSKNKTVTCVSLNNKKAKKVTIPATVKAGGYKFKVTAVATNAFKNSKKLKSVTVGKNVATIGKNAFKGCSKLTKLTVKSAKITKLGKNVLKGTNKKLVVKVPKKCKTAYSDMLKKSGFTGTVK